MGTEDKLSYDANDVSVSLFAMQSDKADWPNYFLFIVFVFQFGCQFILFILEHISSSKY